MSSQSSGQVTKQEEQPFLLFAQHGWADTYHDIDRLARSLANSNVIIYSPDLGWIDTWLMMAPLINKIEKIATEAIATHPHLPLRIIGHSMGGLIWLEILGRHREWWSKVHSLVLIGSPIGGSDLARLFDPLRLFPLIARDLGHNRRPLAEAIAAQIPTVSIMGDLGNHTDGTVPLGCSQFNRANFLLFKGLNHATLKNHPQVMTAIRQFWADPTIGEIQTDLAAQLIAELRSLDLTETNNQNFHHAKVIQSYPNGTKLWQWKSPLQITHIFVSVSESNGDQNYGDQNYGDRCIYSAYTGWFEAYEKIKKINYQLRSIG